MKLDELIGPPAARFVRGRIAREAHWLVDRGETREAALQEAIRTEGTYWTQQFLEGVLTVEKEETLLPPKSVTPPILHKRKCAIQQEAML